MDAGGHGLRLPGGAAWESGARSLGCYLGRDVVRIVVTHYHPDHLGAASWLQERSGAPVMMLGEELRGPCVGLVLPGHRPLFHDLDGCLSELALHHEERLEEMRRVIEAVPRTPFEVSRKVFRYGLPVYDQCFALAETLTHLDHLADEGRAERVDEDPSRILYEAKGGG